MSTAVRLPTLVPELEAVIDAAVAAAVLQVRPALEASLVGHALTEWRGATEYEKCAIVSTILVGRMTEHIRATDFDCFLRVVRQVAALAVDLMLHTMESLGDDVH